MAEAEVEQIEETHLNFEKLCRCCLEESDDLRSLFRERIILGYTTTMKDVLEEFTPISISENDDLPQKICFKCVIDASRSFIFHHTCIKSDSTLREYLISAGNKNKSEVEREKLIEDGTLLFYDNFDEPDETDGSITENENLATIETIEAEELEEEYVKDEVQNDNPRIIVTQITYNKDNDKELTETITHTEVAATYSDSDFDENEEIITEYHENENLVEKDSSEEIETIEMEFNSTNLINDETSISVEVKENDSDSQAEVKNDSDSIETSNITRKRKPRLRKIEGPPYKCEICGKLLSTHSSYNYHKQLHSDKTPYLCSECGQGFKTRNAYDGHMTLHIGGHKCTICNNTYRQIGSLKSHMLMHTGEKPFLCGICGKGMTQRSGYKKHMLTHTGEKPFQCDICQKEFRYSSNLIAHKRSHTGYKSYICPTCEKTFLTHEQLKKHSLIHTGERPFDCKQCGKVFNRKSSLAVHMNLHSGNRKHVCEICRKSYIQLQALESHMKLHNNTKKPNIQPQENDENCEEILIEEIQETTDTVLGI